MSCEEDSGIYVCNDNEYNIWVHYDTMAAYAKYIINYNNSSQTACSVCIYKFPTPSPRAQFLLTQKNCGALFNGINDYGMAFLLVIYFLNTKRP